MTRAVHLAAFILVLGLPVFAQVDSLGPQAKISVLTCAPGNLIYECFGHSAIRVHDPQHKLDLVFNYGIFDFNRPHFTLNFAKGFMEYRLGMSPFVHFPRTYTLDNRTITEQVINLNPAEKQKLWDFLLWNARPENRYYLYDYFYDNCATRVLDVIEKQVDTGIDYHSPYADSLGLSLRDLLYRYTRSNTWSKLGIDLCLGAVIDQMATDRVYNFLPDYVMQTLDGAKRHDGSPMVLETRILHQGSPRPPDPWYAQPTAWFWVIFLLIFWIYGKTAIPKRKYLDLPLMLASGLLGLLMAALWAFTNHHASAYNMNLLWAQPMLLLMPLVPSRLRPRLYLAQGFTCAMLLLGWIWWPQDFNPALVPLVALLAYRCLALGLWERRP
ncbi:MAG: DUF4105 domain-containing protein [Bacteroidetes bacterium]|jgi:hypothetical protein|nr:DUF4105 domain-containing protein [Bacteroidota bacterium]